MKTNNKFFKGVLALCCGVMVCGSMASCGDNDDFEVNVPTDTGDNKEMTTAEITYKVSLGKDELNVNDVVVSFLDKDGKEQTMTMTEREWTWKCNLNTANIPSKFELRVKHMRKANLMLEANTEYEVGAISKIIVVVKNKAGRVICDCDGLGLQFTEFNKFTGEQIMNPWSSTVSGWFDDLTNTSKKTVEVFPKKIVYNKITQRYW